jgi:aspartyl-tRNA(Asn)/glutamyl-tRNA(Gln) amidotransferase subunit A
MKTILQAAEAIRQGKLTPLDLLESCLERISRCEDRVRAWVLVDRPRARAEAEKAQSELKRGYDRGLLHGVPLGVKDIIDVFDWPTACGSRLWKNSVARQDASGVRQLRRLGAVLVGKTVTTQYASFDPSPTRNPWDPSRTPGGSSSGSAAAVACGMCLGALASQTGGSITRPAAYCGVAACKPAYGDTFLDGVLPLAASMDHVGAMARSVRDVAVLMQAIRVPPRSGLPACLTGNSNPPRLGRLLAFFDRHSSEPVRLLMGRVCSSLAKGGAALEEVSLPAAFEEVVARHRVVMAVEAAAYHEERLLRHPEDYEPSITALLNEGLSCPAPEYARCKKHQEELSRQMEACFAGVDCLICPATPIPAPDAATTGDPVFNSPWSYTGLPVVSFPVGFSPDGLPLSVQLIGPRTGETLFAAAAWCEEALGFTVGQPPAVK